MGNCCSDPNPRYSVGGETPGAGLVDAKAALHEAHQAAELLTGLGQCTSWVELRLRCTNLRDVEVLSKSDPLGILYELQPGGMESEVGRTEALADNLNPTFTVPFKVLYNFEKIQRLRLVVVDIDSGQDPKTVPVSKCELLGECTFVLSELVTSREHKQTYKLTTQSSANSGSLAIVTCEELSSAREVITCQIAAQGLKNVEVFSKSDPFLEILKQPAGDVGGDWQPLFRSEVKMNNLNPIWDPFTIRATQLNNGDPYRPLLLRVMDWEATGKPRLLGQVETSQSALDAAFRSGEALALTCPGKPGPCGSLYVRSWQVEVQPTFLDYVSAGTELQFLVAIDFTASNKVPSDPTSLHYAPPGGFTPYEDVLMGVGRVLEGYDTDRVFPAFGFGGQFGTQPVSHCFPLNGQADAACQGIAGIGHAYRMALGAWKLSGPTLFHPVINAACSIASQPSPNLKYTILLIITDGEIMDMKDTTEAIIRAASLPMSILIVGIGNADFSNMHTLDGDDERLSSGHRRAERDIVQFVEFSKYCNDAQALATQLLAELPGQFLEYVRAHKLAPGQEWRGQ